MQLLISISNEFDQKYVPGWVGIYFDNITVMKRSQKEPKTVTVLQICKRI